MNERNNPIVRKRYAGSLKDDNMRIFLFVSGNSLCFIIKIGMIKVTKQLRPITLQVHAKPILGINRLIIIGNMTPPTDPPLAAKVMAMERYF